MNSDIEFDDPTIGFDGTFTGTTGPVGPPAASSSSITARSACAHVIIAGGGSSVVTPDSIPEVTHG